jgi:hypothetical protein
MAPRFMLQLLFRTGITAALLGAAASHAQTAPTLIDRILSPWPPGLPKSAPAPAVKPIAPAAAPMAAPNKDALRWSDAGRILAGEDPDSGSELAALAKYPAVQRHKSLFNEAWSTFEATRLKPTMQFARAEIASHVQARGTVYYPFSGPDALYALALFPDAGAFVLTGLEPVGGMPDLRALSNDELASSFAELRRSLNSIKALSFFQTNHMRAELRRNQFPGVTPILLLFVSRHGYAIQGVTKVVIDADGALRETGNAGHDDLSADRVPGVRIRFVKKGDKRERTLYYFRADLSDAGLASAPQPLKWAATLAPTVTYLKSASYLMHRSEFTRVREFIVNQTTMVVQDDSGIPLRHFPDTQWERAFYGMYDGPIRLFAVRFQKDLLEAYARDARPLDFGIGYDHRSKTSNIQRFVRKPGT